MRLLGILFIGLTILLSGCDTTTSTSSGDTSDKTIKSNNSIVEGVWLVSEEIVNDIQYNFSQTNSKELLTNFLIILNNNGTGFYQTYGLQFTFPSIRVDTIVKTQSFTYVVNGPYLMIGNNAYHFSVENGTLILDDNKSIKHLTPYSREIPLKEWTTKNIYNYGFDKASLTDITGDWYFGLYGGILSFLDDGNLLYYTTVEKNEEDMGYGYWDFQDGHLTVSFIQSNSQVTIDSVSCALNKSKTLMNVGGDIWVKE